MAKRGPKGHKPTAETRKLVEDLAGKGLPQRMICALLDKCTTTDTLKKYYDNELKKGEADACSQVAGKLFQKCMDGDTAAILFWHKTRMGFRENAQETQSNNNAMPVQIVFNTVDANIKPASD